MAGDLREASDRFERRILDAIMQFREELGLTGGGDFPTTGDFEVDETSVRIQDVPQVPPILPDPGNVEGLPEHDCAIGSKEAHDAHEWHGSVKDMPSAGGRYWCPGMPF